MTIIITGAGGFVGRALVHALAHRHDIVALDHSLPSFEALPRVRAVPGDMGDPVVLADAFAQGCDAVIHLATVPGGAAEADPALAKAVNVDATMALTDAAARNGTRPRFLFASSIAVFGDPMPPAVDDATPVKPRMVYGAHKAMMEEWIACQTRHGTIEGLSLRLPGLIARPRGPSGMKSAFMSDLFHALKAGEAFISPVSPAATMWLMALPTVAAAFVHALTLDPAKLPEGRRLTLPALRIAMADLVGEVAKQAGRDIALVRYAPDATLEAAFGCLPPLTTERATALGFADDGTLSALVGNVFKAMA